MDLTAYVALTQLPVQKGSKRVVCLRNDAHRKKKGFRLCYIVFYFTHIWINTQTLAPSIVYTAITTINWSQGITLNCIVFTHLVRRQHETRQEGKSVRRLQCKDNAFCLVVVLFATLPFLSKRMCECMKILENLFNPW